MNLALWHKIFINFIKDHRYLYLLNGLKVTLIVTFFAVILGIVIGLFVAIVKVAAANNRKLRPLEFIVNIYITVIRGTPVMVQLLIIYFVVFASANVSQVLVAIVAFGINSGAYVSETIRSGIMAVDIGQTEAGRSLGFNSAETYRYIVLPQALKNILPALGNEFIALLKETAVVGYIGLQDLTRYGIQACPSVLPLSARKGSQYRSSLPFLRCLS
ncbi:MAG TPA: amino acid ABC transporter permease [Clostridia bacterium]|nr:amino acid ABC transporter permease [Clostridia bacterium]